MKLMERARSKMRILLVEDEPKVSRFVARGLAAERFAVDVASDGKSGLEMANTSDYDLAIMALMLPVMHGSEVLGRIRGKDSDLPILILTARVAVSANVRNFDVGDDQYL